MFKKGQGISINVIVIAAIALLVLVILAILVLTAGKNVNEGKDKCIVLGGTCKAYNECGAGQEIADATDCVSPQVCCAVVGLG
jgi:hypothetical protein